MTTTPTPELIALQCGCMPVLMGRRDERIAVQHCPTHAAAPEMLAVIRATLDLECLRRITKSFAPLSLGDCDDNNLCINCDISEQARALLARIGG
jgi:hypothetical protein